MEALDVFSNVDFNGIFFQFLLTALSLLLSTVLGIAGIDGAAA